MVAEALHIIYEQMPEKEKKVFLKMIGGVEAKPKKKKADRIEKMAQKACLEYIMRKQKRTAPTVPVINN